MAVLRITLLLLFATMTLLEVNRVKGDEMYTTVPPEKQAELEKLDKSSDSEMTINNIDDFSGDVDPELNPVLDAKVNKTILTTPTAEPKEEEPKEEETKEEEKQETETVGGVMSSEESEESLETTTESQDDGSGDIDFFATQFPQNVQHALNETKDEELLPASDGTTTAASMTTKEEELVVPVLIDRKPVNSRPEEEEEEPLSTTAKTEDKGKQVVLDPESTVTDKPTTSQEKKNESVLAVPAESTDVYSKSISDLHDVAEVEELQTGTTSAVSEDNPSAQATKGNRPISRGVIVGIVIIGVLALLALIILLVYLLVFRPRRKFLKHNVDADPTPPPRENGQLANGTPRNNEESMTALVKELKSNRLSSGKDKTYGTELKDDMEDVRLNGVTDNKTDSPV